MQEEKISLYFKDSRSDKEYHAQLKAEGDGFVVTYQNGRRGGTLASGQKQPAPVDYAKAKKTYDATVKEKLGKGYSQGEAGTAFVGGGLEARVSGILPQLLNAIGEGEVAGYLKDLDWVYEEKHDGHCRLIKKDKTETIGINRKGLVTGLPQSVLDALPALGATTFVLHGELMGDVFALFDVLELDGKDLRGLSLSRRLDVRERFKALLEAAGTPGMFVTYTARTLAEKMALNVKLKADGAEGGVFKRLSAPYVPGRPNSGGDQVKDKFLHDATLVVAKRDDSKRSIHLKGLDAKGNWVNLGKCTIPLGVAIPVEGDLVEIRYLYAYLGGSLFQPQYKGIRDDIELSACTLAQLHYKQGTLSEDDEAAGAA